MIMKRLLTIALAMLIFSSCDKDETTPGGGCSKGKLRYSNRSSNPYRIFLDGQYKADLNGGNFIEYDVNKGSHSVKAEQISGYAIYPTIRESSFFLDGCDSKEFLFP